MGIRFIGTLANRLITSLLNFLIVVITARYLGTSGRGEISLIILTISMIQMITGVMGGGAIVYLAPRYPQFKILAISTSWAIISCLICSKVMNLLGLIKPSLTFPILVLSLLVSFFQICKVCYWPGKILGLLTYLPFYNPLHYWRYFIL